MGLYFNFSLLSSLLAFGNAFSGMHFDKHYAKMFRSSQAQMSPESMNKSFKSMQTRIKNDAKSVQIRPKWCPGAFRKGVWEAGPFQTP